MKRRVLAAAIVLIVAAPAVARAQSADAPVTIVAFESRCFDAARLADRVRARVEVPVQVRPARGSAGHEVVVAFGDTTVEVTLTLRTADGRVSGLEVRRLAAELPCETLLETTELMVARAATPLQFRSLSPHPESHRRPRPPEVQPNHPARPLPHGVDEPPNGVDEPQLLEEPVPVLARPKPAAQPAPVVPSARIVLPAEPRHRNPLELRLVARWLFPLDGVPSTPAGDVSLGYYWSARLGLVVRVGVTGAWRVGQDVDGQPITIAARGVPLSVLVSGRLDLRRGFVRLEAGPLVTLWLASSSGVRRPMTAIAPVAGLEARGSYAFEVRRFVFEAGVNLGVAFNRADLLISGVGTVAHTSLVDLGPFVGAGINL